MSSLPPDVGAPSAPSAAQQGQVVAGAARSRRWWLGATAAVVLGIGSLVAIRWASPTDGDAQAVFGLEAWTDREVQNDRVIADWLRNPPPRWEDEWVADRVRSDVAWAVPEGQHAAAERAPLLSGRRLPKDGAVRSYRRQSDGAAWSDMPLRVRTVEVRPMGGHPLASMLAEHLFRMLRDVHDLRVVRLVLPDANARAGGEVPDVDLYVSVERADVTRAKGRTLVELDLRFEACGNVPDLMVAGVGLAAGRCWSRTVRKQLVRWIDAELGIDDGLPLWRLVAVGLEHGPRDPHALREELHALGLGQETRLHAPPEPPAELLLPYAPTPTLWWPDGGTRTEVSSRRSLGCVNDTRWVIDPAGPAEPWLATLRERFATMGWRAEPGDGPTKVALRRGDETFDCEAVLHASAPAEASAEPSWLPAPAADTPGLRAVYRKGLNWETARQRLAAVPAPAQLAWAALVFERLPAPWQQAVVKAPLGDYAGALPWQALVTVAKAQAAAGDQPAARATMGAAFVQAQLAAAFEPRPDGQPRESVLARFDAVWRDAAAALGLPATPPSAARAADVAAVGGVVVPAFVSAGVEVSSRDGFLWLAARADQAGFTAFWRDSSDPARAVGDRHGSPPADARTMAMTRRRAERGLLRRDGYALDRHRDMDAWMRADFAGREARHAPEAAGAGDPPPIRLHAEPIDRETLRVRAEGLR